MHLPKFRQSLNIRKAFLPVIRIYRHRMSNLRNCRKIRQDQLITHTAGPDFIAELSIIIGRKGIEHGKHILRYNVCNRTHLCLSILTVIRVTKNRNLLCISVVILKVCPEISSLFNGRC